MTNFHVAFGPWYVTVLRPPSRKYFALFTLTEVRLADGTHPTARATPVVWGNFGDPYRQMMNAGDDWVYLVLDRCLGAKYGYFSLRAVDPDDFDIQSTRFSSIGYSAGEQRIDPACSLQIGQNSHWGVWLHDCALMPGDSGGPILKQGTLAAVAIGASFFGGPGCPKVPRPARDLPSWANDN